MLGSQSKKEQEATDKTTNTEPRWESRGTVFGVWIDVGCDVGKQILISLGLIASVIPLLTSGVHSCEQWSQLGFSTGDQWTCDYTSAYLLCFVTICATLLLILGARNLLHKRFYYSLLKTGGVLEYEYQFPFRDPLMALLAWDFVHVVWYACWMVSMIWKTHVAQQGTPAPALFEMEAKLNFNHHAKLLRSSALNAVALVPTVTTAMPTVSTSSAVATTTAAVSAGMQAVLGTEGGAGSGGHSIYARALLVICGILTPGLLVVIFAFMDYHIVKSLVPLSEYVEDDDEEASHKAMSRLASVKETHLKEIMPELCKQESLGRRSQSNIQDRLPRDDEAVYSSIMKLWRNDKKQLKARTFASVNFLDSLWPGQIVMSDSLGDSGSMLFRKTCKVFIAFSICVLACAVSALSLQTYLRIKYALAEGIFNADLVSAAVTFAHAAVVCLAAWRIGTCGPAAVA